MSLSIDLTEEELRLAHAASMRGIAPTQFAKELIVDHLPAEPTVSDNRCDRTVELFAQWDSEDTELSQKDISEAETDWNELKANMNASRAMSGEEPLF
jgi:hypothetical protein